MGTATVSPVRMRRCTGLLLGWIALTLSVAACRESAPTEPATSNPGQARIVSLSPALTSTLTALGAESLLVGRTPWCQTRGDVAVVGSLLDLDAEALVGVRPTVILVQPPVQGAPPALDRLAGEYGWRVESFRIDSLGDVREVIASLSTILETGADDVRSLALRTNSRALLHDLDAALAPIDTASRLGRTLVLLVGSESADPLGFGPDTYIGGALTSMGVTNALTRDGYPALSWEALARLAPDTIILLGRRSSEAAATVHRILPNARVAPLDAPDLLQPGGGMVASLRALRATLDEVAR